MITYTVKAGDTLSAIGLRYGVSVGALAAQNKIPNPDLIRVGQVLQIPPVVMPAKPAVISSPVVAPSVPASSGGSSVPYDYGTGTPGVPIRAAAGFSAQLSQWFAQYKAVIPWLLGGAVVFSLVASRPPSSSRRPRRRK